MVISHCRPNSFEVFLLAVGQVAYLEILSLKKLGVDVLKASALSGPSDRSFPQQPTMVIVTGSQQPLLASNGTVSVYTEISYYPQTGLPLTFRRKKLDSVHKKTRKG